MLRHCLRWRHPHKLLNQCLRKFHGKPTDNVQRTKATFGICCDIDGVIARGYVPLTEAITAYNKLTDADGNMRVPLCFVTNAVNRNTNKTEQLSEWLGHRIETDQLVQAQTPLEMYTEYHNKHCLLVGQGQLKEIGKDLGFKQVSVIEDLVAAYPLLDIGDHDKRFAVAKADQVVSDFPMVEAIILMGEPKHWETNLQLIIDLLLTAGKPSHDKHRLNFQTLPIIACNMDLQFMHRAKFPRFGHGAFVLCLESLFEKVTGRSLKYSAVVGKPSETTFRYTEHCLHMLSRRIGGPSTLRTMYMIGDNPDVDIVGANLYQRYIRSQTQSPAERMALPSCRVLPESPCITRQTVTSVHGILVKTGISEQSENFHDQTHGHREFIADPDLTKPTVVLENVLDAVEYILEREEFH